MKQWLARCGMCGEDFVPEDEHDLEHFIREDGEECGGDGELLGYFTPTLTFPADALYSGLS